MATLTAAISSSQREFAVTGDTSLAEPGNEYRIDDEVIVLREFVRTKAERRGPRNPNRWSVTRGAAGTTAASHLIGAEIVGTEEAVTTSETLALPDPFAGEGAPATVFYDEDDPGAVGAGAIWIKPATEADGTPELRIRNEADTAWLGPSLVHTDPEGNRYAVLLDNSKVVIRAYDSEDRIQGEAKVAISSILLHTKFEGTGNTAAELSLGELDWGLARRNPAGNTVTGIFGEDPDIEMRTPLGILLRASSATPGVKICTGTVDPSAGAGVAAPVGSLYLRENGTHYRKTSAPDTGWVTP